MQNAIAPGSTITVPAPVGGATAGTPFLSGGLLCVPITDADAAADVACATEGVFAIAKLSTDDMSTQGAPLYWNDTNEELQLTGDTGTFLVGYVWTAVGAVAGTVEAKLHGVAVEAVPA